jgi:hypothetical protein
VSGSGQRTDNRTPSTEEPFTMAAKKTARKSTKRKTTRKTGAKKKR